ncbi:MAG: hypothetical protein JTJ30_05060 [Catenibacterium mitsuokai]|nr:hypothetical protein [Catenibacterium mitsuokai]MBN2931346.1 hypothetical protein [Catenibacterium mitsuokai]
MNYYNVFKMQILSLQKTQSYNFQIQSNSSVKQVQATTTKTKKLVKRKELQYVIFLLIVQNVWHIL